MRGSWVSGEQIILSPLIITQICPPPFASSLNQKSMWTSGGTNDARLNSEVPDRNLKHGMYKYVAGWLGQESRTNRLACCPRLTQAGAPGPR